MWDFNIPVLTFPKQRKTWCVTKCDILHTHQAVDWHGKNNHLPSLLCGGFKAFIAVSHSIIPRTTAVWHSWPSWKEAATCLSYNRSTQHESFKIIFLQYWEHLRLSVTATTISWLFSTTEQDTGRYQPCVCRLPGLLFLEQQVLEQRVTHHWPS